MNPLRVDEHLPHLQPRDERRCHPGPVALEELDEIEVGADGDDQLGAFLVREQERNVLADPGRGDDLVLQPEPVEPLCPGRAPVPVGVDEQLRARAQGARPRPSPCRRRSRVA